MRVWAWRLALPLFAVYLAVFPGSTITLALDQVPAWGIWFGSALLVLQGAITLAWLAASYGLRGLLAGLLLALLGFAVEYMGATSGFPFGRYQYTDVLQPQLASVVPLAIPCAWMMVVPAAWTIAGRLAPGRSRLFMLLLAATLVLALDAQIETVATHINSYWVWQSSGPYYGVPTANFVAWWLVGLVMAAVLLALLGQRPAQPVQGMPQQWQQRLRWVGANLPVLLYLLSTAMFTVVNLAWGFVLAGLVGVAVLLGAAIVSYGGVVAGRRTAHRQPD